MKTLLVLLIALVPALSAVACDYDTMISSVEEAISLHQSEAVPGTPDYHRREIEKYKNTLDLYKAYRDKGNPCRWLGPLDKTKYPDTTEMTAQERIAYRLPIAQREEQERQAVAKLVKEMSALRAEESLAKVRRETEQSQQLRDIKDRLDTLEQAQRPVQRGWNVYGPRGEHQFCTSSGGGSVFCY